MLTYDYISNKIIFARSLFPDVYSRVTTHLRCMLRCLTSLIAAIAMPSSNKFYITLAILPNGRDVVQGLSTRTFTVATLSCPLTIIRLTSSRVPFGFTRLEMPQAISRPHPLFSSSSSYDRIWRPRSAKVNALRGDSNGGKLTRGGRDREAMGSACSQRHWAFAKNPSRISRRHWAR